MFRTAMFITSLSPPFFTQPDEPVIIRRFAGRQTFSSESYLSIPPETWSQVFRELQNSSRRPLSNMICAVIRLSHVCQQWRYIVLHDPLLWSTISAGHGTHALEFYQVIIQRSQQMPLTIELDVEDGSIPAQQESAAMLFESCLPHIHRVRSLTLAAPMAFLDECAYHLRALSAPLLVKLIVIETEAFQPWPQSDVGKIADCILTGGADKLASFSYINPIHHHIHPPLLSLQKLSLHFDCTPSCDALFEALRGTSQTLVDLDITFPRQRDRYAQTFSRIEMPCMTRARFRGSCQDSQAFFSRVVVAPNLSTLTLIILSGTPAVSHLIGREYNSLELLKIVGFGPIRPLLSYFPMISKLIIADRPAGHDDLESILKMQDGVDYLPNIKSITIPTDYRPAVMAFCSIRRGLQRKAPSIRYID
ncbi:hypothetical protein HWV62_33311 [Athelia sp. TMB]|nr:hypothetical protein HWV62_33311 [Athelia sp. TMB]